jgi:histidyl-tRNA synthetase
MPQQPFIPSGMRDFSPTEIARRNHILNIIRNEFHAYGFMPIETPAMENLSTLLGKYGNEGDKLLFKVLNSGNAFAKTTPDDLQNANLALKVCEKGLRYDLTVPFARYVAQHQNNIALPFRRYQMQPVWRADRPQKGRYREFFQCDADVVGSTALLNEAELILMTNNIFHKLNIDITIKINNRKILYGIAETLNIADKFVEFVGIFDKIEKIGKEQADVELRQLGISATDIACVEDILQCSGDNEEIMDRTRKLLAKSEAGLAGLQELQTIFDYLKAQPTHSNAALDLRLARGLNYYTGAIFEVKAQDASIGSISGGGRYDNLTGIFGLKGISGVGISYGLDRIYDIMLEQNLFPTNIERTTKIMFVNMGKQEEMKSLAIAQKLRGQGIAAEVYPDARKLPKQMEYANRRCIPYVAVIGETELAQGTISVKDMQSGTQKMVAEAELVGMLA